LKEEGRRWKKKSKKKGRKEKGNEPFQPFIPACISGVVPKI
jgi:hypothetical protein